MKTEGYIFNQKPYNLSEQATQSLRHYALIERQSFRLFDSLPEKKGWTFWDNSNIKNLRKNTGTAPTSWTKFEYDIYYPFYF